MPFAEQKRKSWICTRCDFELVQIQKDTIEKIIEILNPNFLSLPMNWKSMKTEWIKVCPRCDNHSLGFETDHVFPIRTKSGNTTTINDLDFSDVNHQFNTTNIVNSWGENLVVLTAGGTTNNVYYPLINDGNIYSDDNTLYIDYKQHYVLNVNLKYVIDKIFN